MVICVMIAMLAVGTACNGGAEQTKNRTENATKKDGIVPIHLYVFGTRMDAEESDIVKYLKTVYPKVVAEKVIPLPQSAYYVPNHRYRAEKLLKTLTGICPKTDIAIGITSRDISTTYNGQPDFGILGLGLVGGRICVISPFRIHPRSQNDLQKLTVHELGHAFGLDHCKVSSCIMHDAEHHNRFKQEPGLCPKCKAFLNKKGWRLK